LAFPTGFFVKEIYMNESQLELKKRRIRFRTKIYSSRVYLSIFKRDKYMCAYCGIRVFSIDDIYKMIDDEKYIWLSKYINKIINHKKYLKKSDTGKLYKKYKKLHRLDLATIDHIIPLSLEENNSLENLVTCCKSCNSKKGSKYVK